MARKSRKQIAVEEPVIESVSSEVFSTAIYARLSVENSGKSEKVDVIANQIEICKSYIAERPYLNLIDTGLQTSGAQLNLFLWNNWYGLGLHDLTHLIHDSNRNRLPDIFGAQRQREIVP